jgi:hypothetical protein
MLLLLALACGTSGDSSGAVDAPTPLPTLKPAPSLLIVPSPTPQPAVKATPIAGEWVQLAPRSERRANFHAESLPDGRILVFGGAGNDGVMLHSEIYDSETDEWSEAGEMPYAITASSPPIRLSNGDILVTDAPAYAPSDHSQIYKVKAGEWSETGPLNNRRNASTVAPMLSGNALLIGGANNTAEPTESVERFNAKTGQWKEAADTTLLQRYFQASLLLDDGTVALIGEGTSLSNRAAIYHPDDDTWTETAPMNEKRRNAAIWALEGGRGLVVGGFQGSESTLKSEIYDSNTDEWTSITDAPGGMNPLGTLSDGRALAIGFDGRSGATSILIYDDEKDVWDAEPIDISFDGDGRIILTADDQIYAFGKGDEFLGLVPETWVYRVPTR